MFLITFRKFQNMFLTTFEKKKPHNSVNPPVQFQNSCKMSPSVSTFETPCEAAGQSQIVTDLGLIGPARPVLYQNLQNPTRSPKIPGTSLQCELHITKLLRSFASQWTTVCRMPMAISPLRQTSNGGRTAFAAVRFVESEEGLRVRHLVLHAFYLMVLLLCDPMTTSLDCRGTRPELGAKPI